MDKDAWVNVAIAILAILIFFFTIKEQVEKFTGDDNDKYLPKTEFNNSNYNSGTYSNNKTNEYNNSNSNSSTTSDIESSNPISLESASHQYIERYGSVFIQINVNLKSLTNKYISKVGFSVYFRDKNYSESDVTAPSEVKYIDEPVNLLGNNTSADVELLILEPINKDMVCSTISIYRVYFSDGTVKNID